MPQNKLHQEKNIVKIIDIIYFNCIHFYFYKFFFAQV